MHTHFFDPKNQQTVEIEANQPTLEALLDPSTGAIAPENVKLRALHLFLLYAQKSAERAHATNQNLSEWFQKTSHMFEACQTLQYFFACCFRHELDGFPDLAELFPDFIQLLMALQSSDQLLKGVKVYPLLEALKQIAGHHLYEEISRFFSAQQSELDKKTRLLREEKEKMERDKERLMKKTGISSSDNNDEAELAAIAWRYFIHNMPAILNDIRLVNGMKPIWKLWKFFTKNDWQEMLFGLECGDLPYSNIPDYIKNGLKIYLTSYATERDFTDCKQLQKSLIGPPKITQFQNDGKNIVRVSGGYLALSMVLEKLRSVQLKDVNEVQILSTETLFMNQTMGPRFSSVNIVMAAKTIDITKSITVDTSGINAKPLDSPNAKDGAEFRHASSPSGLNGENGKPGNPGKSAGHVYIQASKEINNPHLLNIRANGGNGGNGQHGGLGDDGQNGQDGLDATSYGDGDRFHFLSKVHINRGTKGTLGQPGGNGGDAGMAGQGGYAGQVIVRVGEEDDSERVNISAIPGMDGMPGKPGEGGKAGIDGRLGIDMGVNFTGFSLRHNQYLAGLDVKAELVERPWYEKNYFRLTCSVPEPVAKTMPRQCTNTHGKIGASAHGKNASTQHAAIHFSHILQQCPEMAASLCMEGSASGEQLSQDLHTLCTAKNRSLALASDIEEIEKKQKQLTAQQNQLEEIVKNIESQRIQRNIAQQQRISQLENVKSTNDKAASLPNLPFTSELYELESEHYQTVKKDFSDFIETHRSNPEWHTIFEHVFEKLQQAENLPPLEDVNLLFSFMSLRETVSTLLPDLQADNISSWGSHVLLGNTKEKLRHFIKSKPSDDMVNFADYLDQQITILADQPVILHIFYEKLSAQVALKDPSLAISAQAVCDILAAFATIEKSDDNTFFAALHETPLASWHRVLRREELRLSLFAAVTPLQDHESQQKRCLISLVRLEESLGKNKINRFIECIKKAGSTVNYATLANLLMQLTYQQLTLDDDCLSLLEQAPFEQWSALFQDYHRKEIQKPRDLPALLRMMRNDAANEKIWEWLPQVESQIQEIHAYLTGTKASSMGFKNTWTMEDIFAWSHAFRKLPDPVKQVEKHFTEIIAIIARAIFLVNEFYPRDVQYIALLISYIGSDHSQKIISQIDTGEGKTIVILMLALLRLFNGDKVNVMTSSSVLAEDMEREISQICRIFGFTTACNTEANDGPYHLELIEGEPNETQKEVLCNKKGAALVKKDTNYFLSFANYKGEYAEHQLDLSAWFNLRKKLTEQPFYTHRCKATDGLHDDVLQLIRSLDLENLIAKHTDETQKLQQCYHSDILCGDFQSFMRAHLLTEFYGKNITQNRRGFTFIDEVDRLFDEMRNILYLSHEVPDMHHLNNLLIHIWEGVHRASCDLPTEENIAHLNAYFSNKLSPGNCSFAKQLQGGILIPDHLEKLTRRSLDRWTRSAYMAKNDLKQDKQYIFEQIGEGNGRDVYLVDPETGETSLNKKYKKGLDQFLKVKNGRYIDQLTLMAIFCELLTYMEEHCMNGLCGVTGTVGSKQERHYFDKIFGIKQIYIVPRHTPSMIQVDEPILVSSAQEQRETVANLVREIAVVSQQPVEIFCDTIADVKKLNPLLRKKAPEASFYERIYSYQSFSKGSKQNPVKGSEVINTTNLCARGTDLNVDGTLSLILQGVFQHMRALLQAIGRTGRNGKEGKISFVLYPQHGETSKEEMEDRAHLVSEQALEKFLLEELPQRHIIRELLKDFTALAREIENIIRKSEYEACLAQESLNAYVERQMAALKTHWAFCLDEIEQEMEEKGLTEAEVAKAQFQVLRHKMLAAAQDTGPIKLAMGPGEITRLGKFFMGNGSGPEGIKCFEYVIQHFYLFSGQAMYYLAEEIAKSKDLKKATKYLKHAHGLIQLEILRLQESADRMEIIAKLYREEGHGQYHNHFNETVYGMIQVLSIIQSKIDAQIGCKTDVSFFLPDADSKQKAQDIFNRLLEIKEIKDYHVTGKVIVREKRLFITRLHGRREEIEFPSELNEYKEKIIALITTLQGDRKSRTMSYEQYCLNIFGTQEENADAAKKMAMGFSWQFLQLENIIKPPVFNRSRRKKISLEEAKKSSEMTDRALELALGKFREYDNIEFHRHELQNLCERGTVPLEVFTFFTFYREFNHIFLAEQKPVPLRPSMIPVIAGVGLQFLFGVMSCSPFLIEQSIGDAVFLTMSMANGDFSMTHYWRHKLIALGIAGATILTKQGLTWALEQAAKYHIENRATELAQSFIRCIPAPVLHDQNLLTMPMALTLTSALKETLTQVSTELSRAALLNTICPSDIEKHVKESLAKNIQLSVGDLTHKLKKTCMRILKYSESPEQGMLIIERILTMTLNEYAHTRLSSSLVDNRFFSMSTFGKVANVEIRAATGKTWLGNIVGFLVGHLNDMNVTFQVLNGARGLMLEMNKNIKSKLGDLKENGNKQELDTLSYGAYQKRIDELVQRTLHQVGNKSMQRLGATLTPLVNIAYQKLYDKTFHQVEECLPTSSADKKQVPMLPVSNIEKDQPSDEPETKPEEMPQPILPDPKLALRFLFLRKVLDGHSIFIKAFKYIDDKCEGKIANDQDCRVCERAMYKLEQLLFQYANLLQKHLGHKDESNIIKEVKSTLSTMERKIEDYRERKFYKNLEDKLKGHQRFMESNDDLSLPVVKMVNILNDDSYAANPATLFGAVKSKLFIAVKSKLSGTANTKEDTYQDVEEFFKRPCYEDLQYIRAPIKRIEGIKFMTIVFGQKRGEELFDNYGKNTCTWRLAYYLKKANLLLPKGKGCESYVGNDNKTYYAYPMLVDLRIAIEKAFNTKFIEITKENRKIYDKVYGIIMGFIPPKMKGELKHSGHGELGPGHQAYRGGGERLILPLPTEKMHKTYKKLKKRPHKKEFHLFCENIRKIYLGRRMDPSAKETPAPQKNK